jgi:ADP-heptose:LPS heptosyltransferase
MSKILIIKTGAAGDVVRTTVLLNVLQGAAVTWVVDDRYRSILPAHPVLKRVVNLEQAREIAKNETFDTVLSLEEDRDCAALAGSVQCRQLKGIYLQHDQFTYTEDASPWFNLSLYSKLGREAANEAKSRNIQSFQQLLFSMLGLPFNNEPYCIYRKNISPEPGLIGIETRVGARWPNKAWTGYAALSRLLEADGYRCIQLQQRDTITDYLDDIARCSFLISGDTLAMHVALAYKIPSIAIFNCTSAAEIHDYGTMQKIISPLLQKAFYHTVHDPAITSSVRVDEVYEVFKQTV